ELARFGFAQVQSDSLFRGVEAGEKLAAVDSGHRVFPRRTDSQHVGARGGFDANHVGAVVGEILGRDRTNADPGEVEDVNSFQCETAHLEFLLAKSSRRLGASSIARAQARAARGKSRRYARRFAARAPSIRSASRSVSRMVPEMSACGRWCRAAPPSRSRGL